MSNNLTQQERKKRKKTLPMLVMESQLYDWNPSARMTLLVLALGTRSNPEAWIQEDCPMTAGEAVGWCDQAQWRLALRDGKSECQIQRDIEMFEKDGVITVRRWEDSNHKKHDMYQLNIPVLLENQRPSQTKDAKRPKRYKTPNPNRGRFTSANQPKREEATPEDFMAEAAGD